MGRTTSGRLRGVVRSIAHHAKRPIILIPALAIIGVAVWLAARAGQHPAAAATTQRQVTVSMGTIRQTVATSGTLQPRRQPPT